MRDPKKCHECPHLKKANLTYDQYQCKKIDPYEYHIDEYKEKELPKDCIRSLCEV